MNALKNNLKVAASKYGKAAALIALTAGSGAAMAVPPDYTTLTASVDMSTTIDAVLAIFAAVAGLAVVIMGGRKVLGAIRKG